MSASPLHSSEVERAAVEQFTAHGSSYASAPLMNDEGALDALARLAAIAPGVGVIDVACGPGIVSVDLARRGARVTGVDLTPAVLLLAEERAAAEGVADRTTFVHGRMTALDFEDGTFDVAVSRYALHHASDPEHVVRELIRVTKPDGRVVIVDFAAPETAAIASAYDDAERLRDPSHVRNLRSTEQRDLLETQGWNVVDEVSYRLRASVDAVLSRSHGTDHDGFRQAFVRSIDEGHGLGVNARFEGAELLFDYPIVGMAFTRAATLR